jgi:hypothetical protein
VFLAAHAIWLDAPRLAGYLGLGDGLMGLVTLLLVISVRRTAGVPAGPGQTP